MFGEAILADMAEGFVTLLRGASRAPETRLSECAEVRRV
jgi:hypothetical protein